ncbi:MAG: DNA replication/repair protein RecF [Eubacteriales bacterium]|nr:DNA replication/repair protein RecF [Eubacteriales bacterium]
MYVESIELYQYRNYDSVKVDFSSGVNIFFGDNAQGKTNLLEAVYVSGTSKSHKGSKDKDLIHFDKDEAHIRLFFRKNDLTHRLDLHLRKKKSKGIAIDGVPIKKVSELFGMLHIVFFSPEDLSIIKNGPAERRKFLDMEMSQLDKGYYALLVSYNKLLVERNNLLKQIYFVPSLRETLDAWDEQIIDTGCAILRKRESFIEKIDEMMREIHGNLTGGLEQMEVRYDRNIAPEDFAQTLQANRERDIKTGTTSVGPHRDDIGFMVNGTDIRKFGSQGQQRTAALSLKLSEIRLIEQMANDKPVLLLDDVLSELDHHRQNYLLDSISDIQTMISCTGLDDFVNGRISLDKVFRVTDGNIEEYDGNMA